MDLGIENMRCEAHNLKKEYVPEPPNDVDYQTGAA